MLKDAGGSGNLVTEAHYEGYKEYDGINFPSQIEIFRPQTEANS